MADTKTLREALEAAYDALVWHCNNPNPLNRDGFRGKRDASAVRKLRKALAALAAQAQAEPVAGTERVNRAAWALADSHKHRDSYDVVFGFHEGAKFAAPQPAAQPVRQPLTEAQALAAFNADSHGCFADFLGGVRFAERAYGITREPASQPAAVPDGMALVPVVPTLEMRTAASDAAHPSGFSPVAMWAAMLASAPKGGA